MRKKRSRASFPQSGSSLPWRITTLCALLIGLSGVPVATAIGLEQTGQYIPPIGIPAPEFGIDQSHMMYADAQRSYDFGSGPASYPTSDDGPYTHYVNADHPNASDEGNPFGSPLQPRLTVPSILPAGSVVEIHGGSYSLPWHIIADGTQSSPVFVRGDSTDMPEVRADILLNGQYVILENIVQLGQAEIAVGPSESGSTHHVAVRNCELAGDGAFDYGTALAAFGDLGRDTYQVVFYNNYIHHQGDATAITTQDRHGMAVTRYTNNIWVLDNIVHHSQADAIQVNGLTNETTHHIYIGRNIFSSDGENAIDVKEALDVIISQNTMFDYPGPETAAVHAHSDDLQPEGPENVWVIFNKIHDVHTGIISEDIKGDFYAIGNVVYRASDAGIKSWSHGSRHIVGNTLYQCNRGVAHSGGSAPCHILNNIIADVGPTGYHIYVWGSSANSSQMHHNLVHENGGTIRVYWGDDVYEDLQSFQALTGKGAGSIDADPLFADPLDNDFRLDAQSSAIDAAAGFEYYFGLYYSLYGLDIAVGFEGNPRWPDPPADIGAFEMPDDPPAVDNTAPTAFNMPIQTDENIAVSGTPAATDADGDELWFYVVKEPDHGSAQIDASGVLTYVPQPYWFGQDSFAFRAYDGWEFSLPATVDVTVTEVIGPTEILGCYVFYNNCILDGYDATAGASDDLAIAPDKQALLADELSSSENVIGYYKGINGIMIDIADLNSPAGLNLLDFTFKTTIGSNSTLWADAPAPSSMALRLGKGVNGSDRITFIWADHAITDQWLQITVLGSDNTGLSADETFWFGNLQGDTNGDGVVDMIDLNAILIDWGESDQGADAGSDLYHNGIVDIIDLTIVLTRWGNSLITLSTIEGDLDNNGNVDIADLNMVLIDWGKSGGFVDARSDGNDDGTINIVDLNLVLIDWGKTSTP